MNVRQRARMVVSPAWLQVVLVTFLIGFAILGYLAYRIYADHPPVPGTVVSDKGEAVFTGDDIRQGQELFFTYGLMQYGSIYGHGAYLGPDFTADYLHREALEMANAYGGGPEAQERARIELRENRYDPKTDMLLVNEAQLQAFKTLLSHYEKEVLNREKSGGGGLGPAAVKSPDERKKIVAFMAWTAWTASAQRPGKPHSYTNNWPPEKLVGNELTQEAVVWSSLSIIALLGGIGLVLGLYGRYHSVLGWHGEEQKRVQFLPPGDVALTPSQRSVAWYFFIVMALFFLQTLLGGATTHYHAETGRILRLRSREIPPLQFDAHVAFAACAVFHRGVVPGGGNFSCAGHHREGTAGAGNPFLRAPRRAGGGSLW